MSCEKIELFRVSKLHNGLYFLKQSNADFYDTEIILVLGSIYVLKSQEKYLQWAVYSLWIPVTHFYSVFKNSSNAFPFLYERLQSVTENQRNCGSN